MKSDFYYKGHYLEIANKVRAHLNSLPPFLTVETASSPRAIGDAIEKILVEEFENLLGDWCKDYSKDFARRAMADMSFTDKQGMHSLVDVKTHREDTGFNMPNLTSVERLARLYESHKNTFSIIMVRYRIINKVEVEATEVIFTPIEFLSWDCLTIGALGWGQIQIANSENIIINDKASRKDWMLSFCQAMERFYPNEISKIQHRIDRFGDVRDFWAAQDDIWQAN